MATGQREIAGRGTGLRESKGESGRLTRRALLRRLGIGTAAVLGLSYVKPSLLSIPVSTAYAAGRYSPTPTPTPKPDDEDEDGWDRGGDDKGGDDKGGDDKGGDDKGGDDRGGDDRGGDDKGGGDKGGGDKGGDDKGGR